MKALPVRLCAKTQALLPGDDVGIREPEICYCNIKVFRDHGAERKLSHDTAHIQKTIEKLKQRITQTEMRGWLGKRKRGTRAAAKREGLDQSTKTTQEGAIDNISSKHDPRAKISVMQDMLSSAHPVSVLALHGSKEDDPDLYPVCLQAAGDLVRTGSPVSPASQGSLLDSSRLVPHDLRGNHQVAAATQNIASSYKMSPAAVEAVDIDRFPKLLTEQLSKPSASPSCLSGRSVSIYLQYLTVAYFFSRSLGNEQKACEQHFALYLTERTVQDLTKQICDMHNLEPAQKFRILPMDQAELPNVAEDSLIQ